MIPSLMTQTMQRLKRQTDWAIVGAAEAVSRYES
jgi:hypothetical protein